MKRISNGNLAKLVAFFLVIGTLTCTVAYAVSGSSYDPLDPSLNQPSDNTPPQNSNNKDDNETITTLKPIPEYLHTITGLEITREQSYLLPLCFIFSSKTEVYSISSSYLTLEIPIEKGDTRFICFTDDALSMGKIGAIQPARKNFLPIISSFGGILISYGDDGRIDFPTNTSPTSINLKENTGYYYTEYNDFYYTNSDLLRALLKNTDTSTVTTEKTIIPYSFNAFYDSQILGSSSAKEIVIKYCDNNSTSFNYSIDTNRYVVSKNYTVITDPLNDKCSSYDNVFVLYANSTIYESSDFTECVLDTTAGGTGIYASRGTVQQISWEFTEGKLIFKDETGSQLIVNRGSSFISYVKSSDRSSVSIS